MKEAETTGWSQLHLRSKKQQQNMGEFSGAGTHDREKGILGPGGLGLV